MAVHQSTERTLVPMDEAAPSPRRRRRPRHVAALLAAVLYGGAAYAAWILAAPLWTDAPSGGVAGVAAVAAAGPQPALSETSRDLLAMRTLASRAQGGVYTIEAGGGVGSGFVAWVQAGQGRSFLITAHGVVSGVLADKGRDVYVKRGGGFWPGRIVRADRAAGLALIRVDTVLEQPLWQQRARQARPEAGEPAFLVPSGRGTPFGEGAIAVRPDGSYALRTGASDLNLGAPVVASNGRIVGVVVRSSPQGVNRVAPIQQACTQIRRCR